ncbi:nucleotidyltransferase family protein [Streptomyces neyagawaensis]|uniref:Nucleotidyltransferase family protein n=1 Tax=Streptomyces neyagawaensis TaxID=42238 RepID=A0ABV3B9G1_9ACTN
MKTRDDGVRSAGYLADPNDDGLPPDRTQAILEAAKEVASLLKAGGHSFALTGGVAVYAHGGPGTLQHDVDFCVLPEDIDAVTVTLESAGLAVVQPPEDWLLKTRSHGQEVDLIFRPARVPVSRELLDRAEVLSVQSVWMPVLSATDLLIGRLLSFSEHYCDFGSALPIARTLREKIDWARVRRECGAVPMPAAFLYLLERLHVIEPEETGHGDTT